MVNRDNLVLFWFDRNFGVKNVWFGLVKLIKNDLVLFWFSPNFGVIHWHYDPKYLKY